MSSWDRFQNVIWPHADLISNRVRVDNPALLDGEGFALLRFISSPLCPKCGAPSDFEPHEPTLCDVCISTEVYFDAARAALEYDDYSKPMIFALKRAGRRHGLKVMANWMHMAGHELISQADGLVPVPLHYSRQVQRGYNQAVWLAAALGRLSGKPVYRNLLKRTKATAPQGLKNNAQRRKNVSGAFCVSNPEMARGKRLVIIDDVYTTGATVDACAQVLKAHNASHVSIVTLARIVLRETETT